jgi:hypothetical protein
MNLLDYRQFTHDSGQSGGKIFPSTDTQLASVARAIHARGEACLSLAVSNYEHGKLCSSKLVCEAREMPYGS